MIRHSEKISQLHNFAAQCCDSVALFFWKDDGLLHRKVFLSIGTEANCLACNRITKGVAAIQIQSWPALFSEPCDWSPALHLSCIVYKMFFLLVSWGNVAEALANGAPWFEDISN